MRGTPTYRVESRQPLGPPLRTARHKGVPVRNVAGVFFLFRGDMTKLSQVTCSIAFPCAPALMHCYPPFFYYDWSLRDTHEPHIRLVVMDADGVAVDHPDLIRLNGSGC